MPSGDQTENISISGVLVIRRWLGIALGIAGALATTKLLTNLLFNVKPTDPTTFIFVSLCLLASALAAIYIPANRATKVDPLLSLRQE
jgi:putative ABC transport system permease protein